MTVVVTGSTLTVDEVVRVARRQEDVRITAEARQRMQRARDIVERSLQRGDAVYGLNTGLGVLKRVSVDVDSVDGYNRRLLEFHRVGQGEVFPQDVVRAAMLRLVNHFALGTVGVRPELADRVVDALNTGVQPKVRCRGGSLMWLADLAIEALGDFELGPGEGLAMIGNASLDTGYAALGLSDAEALVEAMDAAGAVSLEAFVANVTQLHPFAIQLRGDPGVIASAERIRQLLEGSFLWEPDAPRNLQDPISFRCVPHMQGALRDALEYLRGVVERELNSSQGNPVVVESENRVISVGNWYIAPLSDALDFVRSALASSLTGSQERSMKLLDTPWSGLPTGLVQQQGTSDSGLAMYQILVQALTSEARLLAQPVGFEQSSTSGAEGIEDSHGGSFGAGRLAEMLALAELIVAIELVVATQAVELRGRSPLGSGTSQIVRIVREQVPYAGEGDPTPSDLSGITASIRSRVLADLS